MARLEQVLSRHWQAKGHCSFENHEDGLCEVTLAVEGNPRGNCLESDVAHDIPHKFFFLEGVFEDVFEDVEALKAFFEDVGVEVESE
jgi:hypothetical protein